MSKENNEVKLDPYFQNVQDARTFLEQNIRAVREAKGLNQDEFADKLGIPADTYKKMERGGPVSFSAVVRLCSFLEVTFEELTAPKMSTARWEKEAQLTEDEIRRNESNRRACEIFLRNFDQQLIKGNPSQIYDLLEKYFQTKKEIFEYEMKISGNSNNNK